MSKLYISTEFFTCMVEVNEYDNIVDTAPILKRFIGQPLENLKKWLNKRFSDIRIVNLSDIYIAPEAIEDIQNWSVDQRNQKA